MRHPPAAKAALRRALTVVAATLVAGLALLPAAATANRRSEATRVMTRNLYLGADLSRALNATSTNGFIVANGKILRVVDKTDFPLRARALATEILDRKPDLVGLQEAALWRTGPLNDLAPLTGTFTASTVKYDFIRSLMHQLNRNGRQYRIVKVEREFDFEAPTDYNGVAGDGDLPGLNDDGEINGRLTMRDAILARIGTGVQTRDARGAHFTHLYQPTVGGIPVTVQRGWVRVDAKVRDSKWFRFVDTHLEAFGPTSVRTAQAKELFAAGGPATGRLPVVLVGDLNSDDDTVHGGDRGAYLALRRGGFHERSTADPLGCCFATENLRGGSLADLDHQVDHVMTNAGTLVKLVRSTVSGRTRIQGLWPSDHNGLFSALRLPEASD